MIQKIYIIFFVTVIALIVIFTSAYINNKSEISYIESSNGLQSIQLEDGRTEVEMGDVNNDGHIDFLSIGDHGSPDINSQEHGVMVWFGDGSGSNWTIYQNGNFGYGGIAIGDVNNDGKKDVGYGMHHDYSSSDFGDQLLEVALGDGTGMNWNPWDDSLASQGETWGMFSTDFADVNNDSLLDVGSVSFGCCAGVHVYKNLGTGIWRQSFGFNGGNSSMDFVFGDIDNDGNVDFAVAQQYGTPYFGDGTGNFVLRQTGLPGGGNLGYRGVSLGDLNNDGSKELAFIETSGSSNGKLNVWKWNPVNQSWENLSGSLPQNSAYRGTALYDMNMDGYADLVVFGAGVITIFAGDGGSSWNQIVSFTSHSSPGSYSDFTVGDADHNGFADILILAAQNRNILKLFKEATPFSNLSITPMYPRGYERFKNNSVKFVEWISASPQNQTTKVKLEFSSTGAGGPWTNIADSLPNNGRYQWTTPSGVNSVNCFIRHTVYIPGGSSVIATTPNPFIVGNLVGINLINHTVNEFKLYQNYPNPFNPKTKIRFSTPLNPPFSKGGTVRSTGWFITFKIYDILGREVATLVNDNLKPGTYEVEFDATNFLSGIYFYQLSAEKFSDTKRAVLLK